MPHPPVNRVNMTEQYTFRGFFNADMRFIFFACGADWALCPSGRGSTPLYPATMPVLCGVFSEGTKHKGEPWLSSNVFYLLFLLL
ncbi:hypothetical protein PSPTOT1_4344 [Pseudomonas syringae pv. tomato T1]|nr:hypothetical protein PSPTOT1_4344 [Pseudomonas syringae pv. tomato T1]